MPSVAFGVVLFAVLTVVDRLREPILESIASLDPTFEATGAGIPGLRPGPGARQRLRADVPVDRPRGRAQVRGQPRAPNGPDPVGRRGSRGARGERPAGVRLAQRAAAVEPRVRGVRARDEPGMGIPRLERLPRLVRRRRAGHRLGARGRRRHRLRAHRRSGDGAERVRLGQRREQQPATARLRGLPPARRRAWPGSGWRSWRRSSSGCRPCEAEAGTPTLRSRCPRRDRAAGPPSGCAGS